MGEHPRQGRGRCPRRRAHAGADAAGGDARRGPARSSRWAPRSRSASGGNAITVSLALWRRMEALAPDALAAPRRARPRWRAWSQERRAGRARRAAARHGLPGLDARLRAAPLARRRPASRPTATCGSWWCRRRAWSPSSRRARSTASASASRGTRVAVLRGSGVVVADQARPLEPRAREGARRDAARSRSATPRTHRALLRALLRAARWCDEPEHRPRARPAAGGARLRRGAVRGAAPLAARRAARRAGRRDAPHRRLPRFHRFAASFPWRSHAAWILAQMLRWGQLEKALDVRAVAAEVYWTELHREVAARARHAAARRRTRRSKATSTAPFVLAGRDGPIELGADRFLDGSRFDARRVTEYLRGCELHALRVPLDELEAAQRARADCGTGRACSAASAAARPARPRRAGPGALRRTPRWHAP